MTDGRILKSFSSCSCSEPTEIGGWRRTCRRPYTEWRTKLIAQEMFKNRDWIKVWSRQLRFLKLVWFCFLCTQFNISRSQDVLCYFIKNISNSFEEELRNFFQSHYKHWTIYGFPLWILRTCWVTDDMYVIKFCKKAMISRVDSEPSQFVTFVKDFWNSSAKCLWGDTGTWNVKSLTRWRNKCV